METRRKFLRLLGLSAVLPAVPGTAATGRARASRGWNAWIDLMTGKPPTLFVAGEVRAGRRNRPALSERRPQGFNPAILTLDLQGVGQRGDAYRPVRFERPVRPGQYSEVNIFLGAAMIARIPVGTTY